MAINSDKNSRFLDPKYVVMQSLDVCNLLGYCNTRLNGRNKDINIEAKGTFHKPQEVNLTIQNKIIAP